MGTDVRLTKHHGAGNDFLVVIDLDGAVGLDGPVARALADRHRGIGADGVIRVAAGAGDAPVSMELWNADGSAAEMSGNGIRCLAQAVVQAGIVTGETFGVATGAGLRTIHYVPGTRPHLASASVDMGSAILGADVDAGIGEVWATSVDMGNPHLVVFVDDLSTVDLDRIGPDLSSSVTGGTNVEVVSPGAAAGSLDLVVWERGVGRTQACGTGTCAAVAAARARRLVGDRVEVANPGGTLTVEIDDSGAVRLSGPVAYVGVVDVDPDDLGTSP